MDEKKAMEMKANLEFKGEVEFNACTLVKNVTITNKMVKSKKEKKRITRFYAISY
ncbi:hypothetical protein BVRB_8g188440 [Beta vulgaris subsp. vulgaris]|uniref:Uncharacterized protein n=1 Tax=Beta vulgaris subsp. vulgaris TaxID=3555 RepID=A0A0J8BQQ5_BETVV|nr:hypothetical protein BVRB_8g188440 [Beta vulgaris subsp. vulgaris]